MLIMAALPFAAQADDLQDNLQRHTKYLCSPALEGRKAGSEGERMAAEYLFEQLEALGITMLTSKEGDTFTIVNDSGEHINSRNIVGILEGEDPVLREQYIVIGAHFDHLGSYTVTVDGEPQQRIYPGACADASGIAALIETARMLKESTSFCRRSVIFVGFGAMEEQFGGSRYFATDGGFSYIGDVKMMINLDMLGRGGKANPFEIYSALQPKQLTSLMTYVLNNESVPTQPKVHNGVVFPSDNLAFKQAGIINLTFSTGLFNEYRTVKDTPDLLLYDDLAAQTVYIAAFLRSVAQKDTIFPDGSRDQQAYAIGDCDTPPQFFRHDVGHFLDEWVYKYLKYPRESIANGTQGKVIVSFIVEANGDVTNVTVEEGVSELLDAEAVKVVAASPRWTPGIIGGEKVRTKIVIPVEFRLKKR